MKNTFDTVFAAVLFLGAELFLMSRNLTYLSVWLLLVTVVLAWGTSMNYVVSVLLAVGTVMAVIFISGEKLREGFEDKEEKKEKDSDDPEPHVDMGTTLMNAYKRMKPEQVSQMREDTKELMETQKQLIETLGALGPQVKQGAELIKTFQGMFGGNLGDILKQ